MRTKKQSKMMTYKYTQLTLAGNNEQRMPDLISKDSVCEISDLTLITRTSICKSIRKKPSSSCHLPNKQLPKWF